MTQTRSKKVLKKKTRRVFKKKKPFCLEDYMCSCSPDVGDCPRCNKKCYVT